MKKLPNIRIIQADITKLDVDVIVNAANKSLLGGSGVDGAIHKTAGPQLLEECKTLQGANTGEAKITKGYNLPAKYVIHTPGPRWNGGKNNEESLLADCWRNSLELAKKHELQSIAFPSIATGIYGFPLEKAADIAIREVIHFLEVNNNYDLEVIIVAFDQKTKDVYYNALSKAILSEIKVCHKDLENDQIKRIDKNSVKAFSFAEGGAMGMPGNVCIYMQKEEIEILTGNFAYGSLDIDAVMEYLGFSEINFGIFGDVYNIPAGWRHVDLGMGNHLLLCDYIFNRVRHCYNGLEPGEIYQRHYSDILEVIKFGCCLD